MLIEEASYEEREVYLRVCSNDANFRVFLDYTAGNTVPILVEPHQVDGCHQKFIEALLALHVFCQQLIYPSCFSRWKDFISV